MSQKLIITLIAAAAVVLLIALISGLRGGKQEGSESSAEALESTEIMIVPSEMPEGISFELPAGFTETASQYYDKYYVLNDASIIVTGDTLANYNETAAGYAENVKKQYEATAENFRLLAEEDVNTDGMTGRLLEFTYDISGAERTQAMECTTVIFIRGGKVYLLTCKSYQENYPAYRSGFRRMAESVRIPLTAQTEAVTDAPQAETAAAPAENEAVFTVP